MDELPDKNSTLPWIEKYRPAMLEDLVAHEDIISIREYWGKFSWFVKLKGLCHEI